jgi:hypothetical protein
MSLSDLNPAYLADINAGMNEDAALRKALHKSKKLERQLAKEAADLHSAYAASVKDAKAYEKRLHDKKIEALVPKTLEEEEAALQAVLLESAESERPWNVFDMDEIPYALPPDDKKHDSVSRANFVQERLTYISEKISVLTQSLIDAGSIYDKYERCDRMQTLASELEVLRIHHKMFLDKLLSLKAPLK